jgi:anthranilate phosphoribosyltransferase
VTEILKYLNKVIDRQDLTRDEASRAFQIFMLGGATPAQMAAFLVALRMKGETVEEIIGAVLSVRAKAGKITAPDNAFDCCGTGGDNSGTYNISTAVAFVVAACGVPVAKHGNRAVSSRSGSADVLQALGVSIEADIPHMERALQEAGICFMMAPKFHTAMRHIAPIRQELKTRTLFNLLGPLANPASPNYQLIGVYSKEWIEPIALALKELGTKRAWVVHGADGMDELSTTGTSFVAELKDGAVRTFEITPEELGLERASLDDLIGGDTVENAKALHALLNGQTGAYRDIVLLNAAAGLVVTGKANDLKSGLALAAEAIDSAKAKHSLQKLVEITGLP